MGAHAATLLRPAGGAGSLPRMAEDHDQRLVAVAEGYVDARRTLLQTLLIARADGYSYAEMARVTGLDEGTVRRLVRPSD